MAILEVQVGMMIGEDKGGNMDNWLVGFIKAIARPAVTIIFAATIAQVVVEGIEPPAWFLPLAIPTITWWFAERAITHKKERDNDL